MALRRVSANSRAATSPVRAQRAFSHRIRALSSLSSWRGRLIMESPGIAGVWSIDEPRDRQAPSCAARLRRTCPPFSSFSATPWRCATPMSTHRFALAVDAWQPTKGAAESTVAPLGPWRPRRTLESSGGAAYMSTHSTQFGVSKSATSSTPPLGGKVMRRSWSEPACSWPTKSCSCPRSAPSHDRRA